MLNNKKSLIVGLLILSSLPFVSAQQNFDLTESFSGIFQTFFEFIGNEYVQYGIIFIAYFILLYGILAAGLKRVPAFQTSQNGGELSKNGKLVAVGIAIISVIGLFATTGGNPQEVAKKMSSLFGIWAGLMVSLVLFIAMYSFLKGTEYFESRKWEMMLLMFGGVMMIAGAWLALPSYFGWGALLAAVGFIAVLISMYTESNAPSGGHGERETGTGTVHYPKPPKGPKGPYPYPPTGVDFDYDAKDPSNVKIFVWWEPNSAEQNVVRYEVETRPSGIAGKTLGKVFGRRAGGWARIYDDSRVPTKADPLIKDNALAGEQYEFRFKAINNIGYESKWSREAKKFIPLPKETKEVPKETPTTTAGTGEPIRVIINMPRDGQKFKTTDEIRLSARIEKGRNPPYMWAWYVDNASGLTGRPRKGDIRKEIENSVIKDDLKTEGKHTVIISVRDAYGNTGSDRVEIEITSATPVTAEGTATTSPAMIESYSKQLLTSPTTGGIKVEIISPDEGTEFTQDQEIKLIGRADGESPYAWSWFIDNSSGHVESGEGNKIENAIIKTEMKTIGEHTIHLVAWDTKRNSGKTKIRIIIKPTMLRLPLFEKETTQEKEFIEYVKKAAEGTGSYYLLLQKAKQTLEKTKGTFAIASVETEIKKALENLNNKQGRTLKNLDKRVEQLEKGSNNFQEYLNAWMLQLRRTKHKPETVQEINSYVKEIQRRIVYRNNLRKVGYGEAYKRFDEGIKELIKKIETKKDVKEILGIIDDLLRIKNEMTKILSIINSTTEQINEFESRLQQIMEKLSK
jgi:hypothetical protein